MAYYINTIDNHYNKYKYQYLDHMVATIDLRQNYWDFNMQLIMINNCYLPLNSLLINLALPYQEIKNITFNLASDQSQASKLVTHNMKYAKIYESKFTIDISNNEYLKQELNNAKISTKNNLEFDPEPFIKSKAEVKQEDLDGLLTETAEQRWSWEMYYTNTHIINQSMVIDNAYGYSILKNHEAIAKIRQINAIVNNYSINEKPVVELLHLQSPTEFKIESAKIKFHYWLESQTEEKQLETELDIDKSFAKDKVLSFNKNTMFDFANNKVVIDQGGVPGFFIPKHAKGYYQLEFKLTQDIDTVKFIVKNEFSFNYEINKPHIDTSSIVINDITGFTKLEF